MNTFFNSPSALLSLNYLINFQVVWNGSEVLRCIPQSDPIEFRPGFLCLIRGFPLVATILSYSLARQVIPFCGLLCWRIWRRQSNAQTITHAIHEFSPDFSASLHFFSGQAKVSNLGTCRRGWIHDKPRKRIISGLFTFSTGGLRSVILSARREFLAPNQNQNNHFYFRLFLAMNSIRTGFLAPGLSIGSKKLRKRENYWTNTRWKQSCGNFASSGPNVVCYGATIGSLFPWFTLKSWHWPHIYSSSSL